MTTTLTCPQIKEIYDTLNQESDVLYHKLSVVDTSEVFVQLEQEIAVFQERYLNLITQAQELEKKQIKIANPDIAEMYEKDARGFWKIKDKTGKWRFFNSVTGMANRIVNSIQECGKDGYWHVIYGNANQSLYNPSTDEMSNIYDAIFSCDDDGFWEILSKTHRRFKYNPKTKIYKD